MAERLRAIPAPRPCVVAVTGWGAERNKVRARAAVVEAHLTPAPAQADAELRRRHASARLLVAEDNLVNREVARALLHNVGRIMDFAEDGRVAIEKAQEQSHAPSEHGLFGHTDPFPT